MRQKLQAVLERVKEPETNLSIDRLGLVERIRHHPVRNRLFVFLNPLRPAPACCTIMSGLLLDSTKRSLKEELCKEFPGITVEFACHRPEW